MGVAAAARAVEVRADRICGHIPCQPTIVGGSAAFPLRIRFSDLIETLRGNAFGNVLPVATLWHIRNAHHIELAERRGDVIIKHFASPIVPLQVAHRD